MRLKRPVGRRLAHAAVKMLKKQERGRSTDMSSEDFSGAMTGPTISGCRSFTIAGRESLVLHFNESLLGGESLLLRPFDANQTGGWVSETGVRWPPEGTTGMLDSNGAMVCTVDPTCKPEPGQPCGNVTTCMCQSWNYITAGPDPDTAVAVWYCEVSLLDLNKSPNLTNPTLT